jgi:hypothetical protein
MRVLAVMLALSLVACHGSKSKKAAATAEKEAAYGQPAARSGPFTNLTVHHLIFQEASGIRLKIAYLHARLYPTKPSVIPSFDQPSSFELETQDGVAAIDLGDLSLLLNSGVLSGSQLKDVKLKANGQDLVLSAILHKGVPLPVQMTGQLALSPDGRVRVHVTKLGVLKVPVKALLAKFNLTASDLVKPNAQGIEVDKDDIYIDASKMLPPPHNIGRVSDVHFSQNGDLVLTYGKGQPEAVEIREWRNFMAMRGGAIHFGKITMYDADILFIDMSQDDWFEFDLPRYQEQLVNGFGRLTPTAGLQVFMPDISRVPKNLANNNISLQWMKNRNAPVPVAVP